MSKEAQVEIGPETKVRLGTVVAAVSCIVGAALWFQTIYTQGIENKRALEKMAKAHSTFREGVRKTASDIDERLTRIETTLEFLKRSQINESRNHREDPPSRQGRGMRFRLGTSDLTD